MLGPFFPAYIQACAVLGHRRFEDVNLPGVTDGCYVIDASIFPQIPAVPTNMATMAVAERCADQLRGSLTG